MDALLGSLGPEPEPQAPPEPEATGERLVEVPLDLIDPNPYQPRGSFDDEKIADLSRSIKAQGLLQPIVVRKSGERYQLIAGERRVRAGKLAKLEHLPARVLLDGQEADLEKALVENLQREDLNPIHEALAYQRMQETFSLTQEQVAERVGKNRTTVANTIRLLRLPEAIQTDILAGRLSEGHARALLALNDAKPQMDLRNLILRDGLSVRQAEEIAKDGRYASRASSAAKTGAGARQGAAPDALVSALQERMTLKLGVKVNILSRSPKKGKIVIHYNSLDDFERIVETIGLQESN